MNRVMSSKVFEAEELLDEIESWDEEEIKELPELYQNKAEEFRKLRNHGQE